MSNEQLAAVRARALDGQSTRLIAQYVGVPRSTVRRLVVEHGWGTATTVGRDGRRKAGRRGMLVPAPGQCGVCGEPDCDGHNTALEAEVDLVVWLPCWACQRFGALRDGVGLRRRPCPVCGGQGWTHPDGDDRFPANRYGCEWVKRYREEREEGVEDVAWEVALVLEQQADWRSTARLDGVGRTVVDRASLVRRDWRRADLA